MKKLFILLLFTTQVFAQKFTKTEVSRFQQQAKRVEIIRDTWGIPHIYGKSDADAVFGLLYAQCEDDFKRVEMNYIEKLGRLSEIKGEKELYNDLQIRLLIDSVDAITDYKKAEPWLKKLLNAYADGINFYLHKHPEVKPALLNRFEPWYPLLWTDGSIGAISTADISNDEIKKFYSGGQLEGLSKTKMQNPSEQFGDYQQTGSNGFAIAPSKTASGNAILYINPHVTFYFRPEVQVVSEEGLNAYGAVTWGQIFVYQGFNQYCGWMHTSSNVDVADMYAEKIVKKNDKLFYEYDQKLRPITQKNVTLKYLEDDKLIKKKFTTYYTHHGPVMAKRDGKWISLRSYNRSMTSLVQSWKRTKAKGFEDYKKVMDLKANTSNNTVFADAQGNIAYWHGNYVPVRDTNYNWGKVVDGTTSKTEWKGLHAVDETVHSYNPVNGWLQNCNSTPYTVAGENSPKRTNFRPYMAPDGENFRGINAVRVLSREKDYTIEKVIAAGYDTYLSAFAVLIPAITKAFDSLPPSDTLHQALAEPMSTLKNWNYYAEESSVATTLAIETAQKLSPQITKIYIEQGETDQVESTKRFAANATKEDLLLPLLKTVNELKNKFGTWQKPWGELNHFQRITGEFQEKYDDTQASLPVGFASALWGSLPSFNSRYYGTQKRYGLGGNSFVCAVEFGKKIKAKSLLAGGNSGDKNSKHFTDQALMYTQGKFKDVLFYKEDVLKNVERRYWVGE
ncbi:penicillin acylase family protein [Arcicella sp. LKC2W]|uniref:penicillin acylase family protein n=1 Tax=Arcicella sp. LKC2W TaxID=2984198 RepID=UPI002B1FC2A6|nr:penicillin acylase family protein [Arcicella sp. LKC2W]MEA5460695.1 penicillin acylase family protein [Arcicella sp. LKC2W]